MILTLEILNFCSFHKKIGSIRRFTIIKGNIDSERFYIFLEKIFRSSHHALKKLLNCTNIVEDSPSRILNFSSFHKRIESIAWSTIIKGNKMEISSEFIFFIVEKISRSSVSCIKKIVKLYKYRGRFVRILNFSSFHKRNLFHGLRLSKKIRWKYRLEAISYFPSVEEKSLVQKSALRNRLNCATIIAKIVVEKEFICTEYYIQGQIR